MAQTIRPWTPYAYISNHMVARNESSERELRAVVGPSSVSSKGKKNRDIRQLCLHEIPTEVRSLWKRNVLLCTCWWLVDV